METMVIKILWKKIDKKRHWNEMFYIVHFKAMWIEWFYPRLQLINVIDEKLDVSNLQMGGINKTWRRNLRGLRNLTLFKDYLFENYRCS